MAGPRRDSGPGAGMTPAPIDLLAEALDGRDLLVSRRRDQITARCPCHDDRNASLSVGVGRDGRALVHCHAGCDSLDVLDGLGLAWPDLFPNDGSSKPWTNAGLRRVGASLESDGRVRFGGVRYLPGAENGDRKSIADAGRPRELYPDPATVPGDVLYVPEGEPDAATGSSLGLATVAVPGAAGWRSEWAARLAQGRRRVVVIADSDEAGRKAAEHVAGAIAEHCPDVRVLDLAPERSDGFDLSDYAAEGHGAAELVKLAEQAATVGGEQPDKRVIVAESFATIRAQRTRWLWAGRIPLGAPTLLVGREKLGKSTLTVTLAAGVSRGTLEGDLKGTPADVLIVSYEDNARSTIKPRLLAANADPSRVHALAAKRRGVYDLVSLPDDVESVREAVRERKARLLIVDPFSASLAVGIDSHRDGDMRRAIAALAQLAEDEDLAVALVAHFNKGTAGDSLTRVLGSRALTAASRSVLVFGRAPDAEDRSPDRVLAHSACNVAAEAPSLACRIEPRVIEDEVGAIETSRLVILGDCETQADELLSTRGEDDRSDRDIAADWLRDELADGDWHRASEIKASAKIADIRERTLHRARKVLGVEDRREGFPAVSEWRLPVVPSPADEVGTTVGGTTRKTRNVEPNPADSRGQLCQTAVTGTTGVESASDCARPDAHADHWKPHPLTARMTCWRCHPPAGAHNDRGDREPVAP